MDLNAWKEAVSARCREKGIAEYEIYYQLGESTCVGVFQQEVEQFTASVEGGLCLRCIVDGKMGYASTEDLDPSSAAELVDRAADNAAVLETDDPVFLGQGGQRYEPLERKLYELPTTENLIATALEIQKQVYAASDAVVDGTSTRCLRERTEIGIWNSKGLDLSYVNHVSGLVTVAVVSNGTEMANDAQIRLGELAALPRQEMVQKAVQGALKKLGGQVPPTCVCPVVFSPEAMAELLQTFRSVFSAEAAQKGLSRLAQSEGTAVASEVVTIMDDPFHPDSPMPIHFDAEGSPTRRKAVVENGVLKTLLYDLKTAAKAGRQTTGNAAKAGYNAPVAVRPFTMYLAPGKDSPEELIRQAGEGVYIDSLQGTHAGADPVSGDLSLQSAGYLIRDGVLTDRIKAFTVAGNFYDLLKKIRAVGSDMELKSPLGMTAFGAPTVLVDQLSIAGK